MGWLVWVVIAVVGAPAAWFLLKAVVGAAVPPHVSGKLLLKKELQKHGVDPARLSDACLSEITQSAIDVAEGMNIGRLKKFTTAFVEYIEFDAVQVARYLQGDNPSTESEPVYAALKRHGVLR